MNINELELLYNNNFKNGDIVIVRSNTENLYKLFCTNPSSILMYKPYLSGTLDYIENYIKDYINHIHQLAYDYILLSIENNNYKHLIGSVYGLNNEVFKNIIKKVKSDIK